MNKTTEKQQKLAKFRTRSYGDKVEYLKELYESAKDSDGIFGVIYFYLLTVKDIKENLLNKLYEFTTNLSYLNKSLTIEEKEKNIKDFFSKELDKIKKDI